MLADKILVIGAAGQIGVELTIALQLKYGKNNVIAADIKERPGMLAEGAFYKIDVLKKEDLYQAVTKENITQIYLLAAVLSATGEKNPTLAWNINMQGLLNVLEIAKEKKLHKVYWPSSIAVFGATSPKQQCPQQTIIEPSTVYGISKYAGELWCSYYYEKYGVDVRSIRYPGLISYMSPPGGGTTDYAVEIFYHALEKNRYECFLNADTYLPMMYMPDAIKATIDLMEAPTDKLTTHLAYNVAAMSFSPAEIASSIKSHIPNFDISYQPDYRQEIASSWPQSIDDSPARADWGWAPDFDLNGMTADMIKNLRDRKI